MIRAPFDGLMLGVDAAPGQTIVSDRHSQPFAMVANERLFRPQAQIDSEQAGLLQRGSGLNSTARGKMPPASDGFVGYEPRSHSETGPLNRLVAEILKEGDRALLVGETVVPHLE